MKMTHLIAARSLSLLCMVSFLAACNENSSERAAKPVESGIADTRQDEASPQSNPPATGQPAATGASTTMPKVEFYKDKVVKSEDAWRAELSPDQFHILREKGTERAFTGKYWNAKEPGVYRCSGCFQPLFFSDSKFDSHCGWPSFDRAAAKGIIEEHKDTSYGMIRTEVTCARCGAHLGHIFDDGPTETGMRYCINSASIEHEPMPAPPPSQPDKAP